MNERNFARRLTYAIFKINGIENSIDKEVAIGYAELCLMYALDDGLAHTQRQISEEWQISKTTLNTIVKKLEKEGYIELNKIAGKRREMEISLTDAGLIRARESLEKVYAIEDMAIAKTIEKYSDKFVEALEFYAESLKNASEIID